MKLIVTPLTALVRTLLVWGRAVFKRAYLCVSQAIRRLGLAAKLIVEYDDLVSSGLLEHPISWLAESLVVSGVSRTMKS